MFKKQSCQLNASGNATQRTTVSHPCNGLITRSAEQCVTAWYERYGRHSLHVAL